MALDMQDHEITVGESTLDLAAGVRRLVLAQGDEGLEAFDAIRRRRIVLNVFRSEVLGRGVEIFLVQRLLVEVEHDLLVGRGIGSLRRRGRDERQHGGKRKTSHGVFGPGAQS
jgi:hypothetical protein